MGGIYPTHAILQRFALKPKPRITLKALPRNAFKVILAIRLISICFIPKAIALPKFNGGFASLLKI
ncbi:MAG: hypothetical protein AUK48_01970 [Oscillatoriales cyanobacterium CG2_30_44_21]|nr:MAG: hypothetical protein AUK48_01970 [Oscillatoriales cyanobacterium CG2_30_44_21]